MEFGIGGKSVLVGGKGNDLLVGNAAGSALMGSDGQDTLVSTYNNDTLSGGADADTFVLGEAARNVAEITDFSIFEGDVLDITSYVPNGASASSNDIRARMRMETEDDGTVVYAQGMYGDENTVARLQGV